MLKQTEALKNIYETSLITGTITDAQLRELLVPPSSQESLFKSFKQSPPKSPKKTEFNLAKQLKNKLFSKKSTKNQGNDSEVNDNNFGVMDGMKDFVLHIAPMMSATVLHDITAKLIRLSPDEVEKNTYMRNANLVKVFLAYELYAFPDNAKKNLASERMQKEFSGPNDIANLRRVILEPSVVFFETELKTQRMPFNEDIIQTPAQTAADISRDSDVECQDQDSHSNYDLLSLQPPPQLPVELPQESSLEVLNATDNYNHQQQPLEPVPVAPELPKSSTQTVRDKAKRVVEQAAMKPQQTRMSRMPEAASVPSTKVVNNEQDARLAALIKLCQNYLSHLGQPTTTDAPANNKLNLVNNMLEELENPHITFAGQKIRNMNRVLTPENKAILAEQRSGMGIKFLETLLHVLTAGLYAKYSKNTFAFWKSHGEALADNIEQLTRDNNEALKL